MNYRYILSIFSTLCMVCSLAFVPMNTQAQETVYNENFGFPAQKSTPLSSYTDFQSSNVVYRGTVDVRNNKNSEIYPLASAGGNVYFNNGPQEFSIHKINTKGYNNLSLSFGIWYQFQENATQATPVYAAFSVEYSTDGQNWTALNIGLPEPQHKDFALSTGETKDGDWALASKLALPECDELSLRFTKTSQLVNFRVDDINISAEKPTFANLILSHSQILFDSIYTGSQQSQTFHLQATGVQSDVQLALAFDTNFKLSQTTVSKEQALAGIDITVTFDPQTAGLLQDHIVISTEGAYSKEIIIRGTGTLHTPSANKAKYVTDSSFVASWNPIPGAEKYLINVYTWEGTGTETVLLFEDFSKMIPQGDLAIGTRIDKSLSLTLDDLTLNSGWSGTMLYLGADDDLGEISGVVRIGKKDARGNITTPMVNMSRNNGHATLRFKLRTYANQGEHDELLVLHLIDGVVTDTLDNLKNLFPETFEYSYPIENGSTHSQIRLEAKKDKDNRFILTELKIVQGGRQKVFTKINKSAKLDTQFEITGLKASTTYYYTVRVYSDAIFNAPISEEVSFQTKEDINTYEEPEKIEDSAEENDLKVSAANGVITVSNVTIGEKIEVYNVLGLMEEEMIASKEEVSIPMNKNGVYFVKTMNKTKKVNVGKN